MPISDSDCGLPSATAPFPCHPMLQFRRIGFSIFFWISSIVAIPRPLHAVIFWSTANTNFNTTAPSGALAGSGWQWVGNWGGFQGTAIGPNHFVTARHVGGSVGDAFTLNGTTYTTTAFFDDASSDLRVCRVSGTFPSWAPLYRTGNETGRTAVVMGRGMTRGQEVKVANVLKGWQYAGGDGRLRWGSNVIGGIVHGGSYWGQMLYATFDESAGADEAHLATGDSGGPMFVNDGAGWKLAGIAGYVDAYFHTSPTGAGFMAAIFDLRGLYYGPGPSGPWSLVNNSVALPSAFFATRISQRLAWIDSVVAPPPSDVAPSISSHPASLAATAGTSVSLTVTASGSPTPTYAWLKNGSAIPGATSANLSFASLQSSDAGSYTVVVTNSVGSVTSNAAILTVNPAPAAPSISAHPASQTVTAGANVSLSVTASGVPAPTYQWQRNGVNIAGATSSTLALNAIQVGDAGSYTVVVSNASGSVTSDSADLTVNPAPAAPSISSQPVSQTVTAGANVSFSVTASGVPSPTFQWTRNTVNIAGATSSTLTLNSVSAGSAGTYTVVVSNASGSVTSNSATLTVNPAPVAPSISSHPASQTVIAGTNVSLSVTASGVPSPTFQWKRNTVDVPGATSSTLTLIAVQAANAGSYTVVVSNASGSVNSNAAIVTVNPAPAAPSISSHPVSQTITAGNNVSFSVTATGVPSPTFQWKRNAVDVPGATSSTLALNAVQAAQAGTYTVLVSNASGSLTSSPAVLTVLPALVAPSISVHPTSQTAIAGTNISLYITASGTPSPSFQWRKNGSDIPGASASSLTLNNLQAGDAGSYTVFVSNAVSSVTSNAAILTVNPAPAAPSISSHPVSQTVTTGANVSLAVTASGEPSPTFQWQRNAVDVPGATSSTLSLIAVQSASAGSYTVVVSNASGSVTSNAAIVTVQPAPAAPILTSHPASQTVLAGTNVSLTVTATGMPTPSFQWRKDGTDLPGQNEPTLSLTNVQASSAGSYTVVVSNASGSVTSNAATLTVNPSPLPPAILSQPAGQTVAAGSNVSFSVTATGLPAPSFQWRKEGSNLVGQTSATLSLANAQSSNAGTYTVVVSNPSGSVTSDAATLTVIPAPVAPTISAHPVSQIVTVGASVTFSVTSFGVPTPMYQWFHDGSALPSQTAPTLSLTNVQASSAGSYAVVVSNASGSVTSNAATLLVNPAPAAPTVTSQPASQTVTNGTSVSFTVTATGTPTPSFQWRREGSPLPGQTAATLTLTNVQPGHAGSYTVVVSNSSGSVTSNPALLAVVPVTVAPIITTHPSARAVTAGSSVTFAATASGAPSPSFQWLRDGQILPGATSPTLTLFNVRASDVGVYSVQASNSAGRVTSESAALTLLRRSRLRNLSVRSGVASGEQALILGFVTQGATEMPVLVRAIGPFLQQFGVGGTLRDPRIQLLVDSQTLATNDDWGGTSVLQQAFSEVGAFPLPSLSKDSALLARVSAGAFTLQVAGDDSTPGVALVEIYDASISGDTPLRLINLSARNGVGNGEGAFLAGFVIDGDAPMRLLLRGVGPTLVSFGLRQALPDPVITLRSGDQVVAANDDWAVAAELAEATAQVGAFALPFSSLDAALVVVLTPGAYTLQLEGKASTTGTGLIEVYELP